MKFQVAQLIIATVWVIGKTESFLVVIWTTLKNFQTSFSISKKGFCFWNLFQFWANKANEQAHNLIIFWRRFGNKKLSKIS